MDGAYTMVHHAGLNVVSFLKGRDNTVVVLTTT